MISKESWALKIDRGVYKDLSKIPKNHGLKILAVIEDLPTDPHFGDIQKIKGEEKLWRRRVGQYRIFYEILAQEKLINVLWVEKRSSNTY